MQYYFAPMEGITGFHYRNLHHQFFPGVDKYFTPFFSPGREHKFPKRAKEDFLPNHNRGLRVVPQLLTRNAEDFLWAAGLLADLGYEEVNLNLGCPSGTVTAKGKGAGFLADPEGLDRFLEAVFSKTPLPVSVKTRLGLREAAEFGPLLAIFNRYPLAELILHPRVRTDLYRRPARPEIFDQHYQNSASPVCYNGDLVTQAGCAAFEREHPTVTALMLGRGLVANPALVARCKGGPAADRATLYAFLDGLYQRYAAAFQSRRNAMLRMKEIWYYFIHLFAGGEQFAKRIRREMDPDRYEGIVKDLFQCLPLREEAEAEWLPG